MSGGALSVTDGIGNTANVITTDGEENKTWNIICRDIEFKGAGGAIAPNPFAIISSSSSVAHHIDNVLCFSDLFGYDGKVQRFASNGAKVETLLIDGMKGLYEADGNNYYLIAAVNKSFNAANGKRYVVAGYLMEPKKQSDCTKLSREKLVYDSDEKLILITKEGYRVEETVNADATTYNLVTDVETALNENGEYEECVYARRYENNGKSYQKVLIEKKVVDAPVVE